MASLAAVGLRHVYESNQRLKLIAETNNAKTALATAMQNALRERALSVHALSVMTDPFDKDAELQRFYSLGTAYIEARERLEALPLSREERAILDRIRTLTREAQPQVEAVVAMAMTDSGPKIYDLIRTFAVPRQRVISQEVDKLIRLQQELTAEAVARAEASYRKVRNLMLLLGGAASCSARSSPCGSGAASASRPGCSSPRPSTTR